MSPKIDFIGADDLRVETSHKAARAISADVRHVPHTHALVGIQFDDSEAPEPYTLYFSVPGALQLAREIRRAVDDYLYRSSETESRSSG